MAPLLFLALLSGAPALDVPAICRGEAHGLPRDQQTAAYQMCLRDEKTAREEIQRNWTDFPAETRATCAMLGALVFSYVELMTCIEIKTAKPASSWKWREPPATDSSPRSES
jgi:hypothetical protein